MEVKAAYKHMGRPTYGSFRVRIWGALIVVSFKGTLKSVILSRETPGLVLALGGKA